MWVESEGANTSTNLITGEKVAEIALQQARNFTRHDFRGNHGM